MADKQIPLGRTAVYGLLPEADAQKIIDAVFQLMRETGVAFDPATGGSCYSGGKPICVCTPN